VYYCARILGWGF
nr:immunoglobulin heavy chain junction region [Mus musculus]